MDSQKTGHNFTGKKRQNLDIFHSGLLSLYVLAVTLRFHLMPLSLPCPCPCIVFSSYILYVSTFCMYLFNLHILLLSAFSIQNLYLFPLAPSLHLFSPNLLCLLSPREPRPNQIRQTNTHPAPCTYIHTNYIHA